MTTGSFEYNIVHDESVVKKRTGMNFSVDLNKNLPKNGVSLHRRWGLRKNIDWGLHASLDSSGADIKYNYINLDRFASALGLKILAPFLSIDEFENLSNRNRIISFIRSVRESADLRYAIFHCETFSEDSFKPRRAFPRSHLWQSSGIYHRMVLPRVALQEI